LTRRLRILAAAVLAVVSAAASAQGDPKRGEYVAQAAGCAACHTDSAAGGAPYAGGRAIDTPFGTFYGPNITPQPQDGIGKWTEADFRRALRLGERPDGADFFPVFPYPSFSRMADADIRDLWAYLRALPPVARPNREHQVKWPFRWRLLISAWKWLFFTPGPFVPDAAAGAQVNRGAYLVTALGHCGECHTPRNFLGGPKKRRALAGGKLPEGRTPNLTPTRLKRWSDRQLKEFLRTGVTPDGDAASDLMDEVIRNDTSKLTAEDLSALVAYLRALTPLPDEPK
jgi:mono/diheme cytochrome c family protein